MPSARHAIYLLWLILAVAPIAACESEGSVSDCQRLRDHVAQLAIAERARNLDPDNPRVAAELAKHTAVLSRGLGERFVARCERDQSALAVTCSLEAEDRTELAACRGLSSGRMP